MCMKCVRIKIMKLTFINSSKLSDDKTMQIEMIAESVETNQTSTSHVDRTQ